MSERIESTKETCPRHIWKHEVVVAAIALGADGETCRAVGDVVVGTGQSRLTLWYETGEPVWMAAETLAAMAKGRVLVERADKDAASLRRMLLARRRSTGV